ncbi:thiamine pyrophosphate-binding protein [Dactylosporangium sp. NPDC000244]|uniref:thiamine pyrophosphate-binding protein n=1 Tax=Dactylosporangium sp. NPDC000244 TaxID=3154365 RepID=UPI00332AF442
MSAADMTEPETMTGAAAVATLLAGSGVREVFGYIGTSELALASALRRRLPAYRNARGDREAVFMAAGASAFHPGRAAALLHGARGLTNAAGALGDAWRNEAGFLCLVGLPGTASQPFLPPHGEPRLIESVGHFAKAWYELPAVGSPECTVDAVEALIDTVATAIETAREQPCGPVLLGLPQDVLEGRWVPRAALAKAGRRRAPAPAPAPLSDAVRLIEAADRPVVLLDDYLLKDARATATLREFTERVGAPALQVRYRRGPMLFERVSAAAVPAFAGWYDPSRPEHAEVLAGADLIITLEDRNMYPRVVGDLPDTRKIAFTCAPERTGKNGYLGDDDVVVSGDTCANLSMVSAALRRAPRRIPAIPPAGDRPADRSELWPLARTIGETLAEVGRPVIVDDSQMFGGLMAQAYDTLPEGTRVLGDHGAFVGGGLATAIGVALGNPDRSVVCTLGDQGFTNGVQGLVAALEHRVPVTLVVCNNGGSVSLRKQLDSIDGDGDARRVEHLDNVQGFDYVRVASALGMPADRVVWPDDADPQADAVEATLDRLRGLLRGHHAHPGPSLLELVVPGRADAWAGIWSVSGLEPRSVGATA